MTNITTIKADLHDKAKFDKLTQNQEFYSEQIPKMEIIEQNNFTLPQNLTKDIDLLIELMQQDNDDDKDSNESDSKKKNQVADQSKTTTVETNPQNDDKTNSQTKMNVQKQQQHPSMELARVDIDTIKC